MKEPVSLIATVRNEEDTIEELLESIEEQTRKPDEIIFVDALSTDNTVKLLKKHGGVKVIERACTIGEGRNVGVRAATHDIIAVTDGGCVLDRKWLENITAPFENNSINFVAGAFLPKYENMFQECLGRIVCHNPRTLDKSFLPSSRSVAFRKRAWAGVGGYPDMNTGEDTLFDIKMKKRYSMSVARDAVVYWRMRKNLGEVWKQFYLYGRGDGKLRVAPRSSKLLLLGFYATFVGMAYYALIGEPLLLLLLPVLPLLYPILAAAMPAKDIKKFVILAKILYVKMFAYFAGFHRGLMG